MELRHIRYFVAVAETLHFGRAARALHISQPPLSQQIRDLEREIGVMLFHRTRRSVELTPAGTAFLERARRLLSDAAEMAEASRRAERGELGELTVGFVHSAGYAFSAAARRLNMSQPPLSMRIAALEREAGVRLLHRSRPRVAPTAAGEMLLGHARRILAAAELALAETRRAARGEAGRVRLGFTSSAAHTLLPRIMTEAARALPGVALDLREMAIAEQLAALGRGELDLALVRPPVGGARLRQIALGQDPFVLAVPEAHRLARRRSAPLAALAEEPVVMYPAGWAGGFRDLIFGACREAGFVPRVVQEVVQVHTVLALVGAGIGIGFVPASIAAVGAPRVAFVAPRPAPETRFTLAFDAAVESPARDRLAELIVAAGADAMTAP